MPRPPNADSEETHRRLMEAARRLLEAHGPKDLSMRKVAARAEMSIGTLTYYFANREELLEAILDEHYQHLEDFRDELMAVATSGARPEAVLTEAARLAYIFVKRERAAVELRAVLNNERGELHPRRLERFVVPTFTEVGTKIAERWGQTPRQVRMALQSMNFAIVRWALLPPEEARAVIGLPTTSSDAALEQQVIDHLGELARAAFLPRAPSAPK